jgi:phosphotransferase system enzyme I (PtsI)
MPARRPSSPSWPAASQRGPPQPQRAARQCQEHHGRDDAGRRHGHRDRDRGRRARRAGAMEALRALIDGKFGEGGVAPFCRALWPERGCMSIQIFGLPVSRVWPSAARCWWRPAASTWPTTSSIRPDRCRSRAPALPRAMTVAAELMTLKRDLPADAPAELALLDVHLMLLHDEALMGASADWIRERHYNAEWALSAQLEVLARQFDEMEDAYLRERKADLEQVVERLLRSLSRGVPSAVPAPGEGVHDFGGDEPLVLVASDIAPADMLSSSAACSRALSPTWAARPRTRPSWRAAWTSRPWWAREASPDPPGRLHHHRRRCRRGDRRPLAHRAGGVPLPPAPERAGAQPPGSPAPHAGGHAGRRARRTAGQHRDARRRPRGLEAGAVGVGLFRSEFLFMNRGGRPARRRRAVRGLPPRRRGDERPAGHDPHGRHRRRQAAGGHDAV